MNHLSNPGKEIKKGREPPEIPGVAASETGGAQTASSGVVGPHGDDPWSLEKTGSQRKGMGRPAGEGESPVGEVMRTPWCGT